jgi:hypothetical protein
VPDFFVRHPMERPTRTLALSLGQGIKQSPKSATFRFWRIVDHTSSVQAGIRWYNYLMTKNSDATKLARQYQQIFDLVSLQLHTFQYIDLSARTLITERQRLEFVNSLEQFRGGSEIRAGLNRTPKCDSKWNGADTKTCEIDQTKGHRERLNQPRLPSPLSTQSN